MDNNKFMCKRRKMTIQKLGIAGTLESSDAQVKQSSRVDGKIELS